MPRLPGVPRAVRAIRCWRPVPLAAAAAWLLLAPAVRAQEATVPLLFTEELLGIMLTDNQGERTGEVVGRILGLSPSVRDLRLQRSGAGIGLTVTVSGVEEIPVTFRFDLDKMVYYRMRTAPDDVVGMIEALQQAKSADPLVLGVGYRFDGRHSIVDVRVDMSSAFEEVRKRRERRAAAEQAAAAARAAAQEKAAAEARAAEEARRAKAAAAAAAAEKAAAQARTAADAARARAATAAAAAAKAAEEATAAIESARIATEHARALAAAVSPAPGPAPLESPAVVSPAYQTGNILVARALGSRAAPVVDGRLEEAVWREAPQSLLRVSGASGEITVAAAAVWSPERLWVFVRWPDASRSTEHHPWVWSEEAQAYREGLEAEDAFSLAFSRKGRMGDCMLGGAEAELDLWTWRAGRTDPSGYAEDGTMTLSSRPIPRGTSFAAPAGGRVWVRKEPDDGVRPYQTLVAGLYAGERLSRYYAVQPSGSVADVTARGTWSDGFWTVEFSRRLSTGDPADAAFLSGREVVVSAAVFDGREGMEHSTSTELALRLELPR